MNVFRTEYNCLHVRCIDIDYAASAVSEDELALTVPEDELASTVPEDESASVVSEDVPEQSDAHFIKVIRELVGNLARRLFPSSRGLRASEWTLTTRSHIMFILRTPRAGHLGRKVTDTLLGIDYIYLRRRCQHFSTGKGGGSLNFGEDQKITGPRVRDIKELKYLTKNVCNLGYFIPRLVVGLPSSNTRMKEQSRRSVGSADKPCEIKNSKLRSGKQTLGRRMSEAGGRRKDPYLLSNQRQLCKIRQRKTLDSRNRHVSRLVVPKV
nr:hypothetical protein [Tanacetum cinerariifolium]